MLNKQKQLEEEMIALGVKRYRENNQEAKKGKHESTTPAGIQFIRKGCAKVAKAIDVIKGDILSGKPTNYNVEAVQRLAELPSDVIAFLALKGCVNHLSTPVKLVKVSLEVGGFIEDEARFRNFKSNNPALFGVVTRDLSKRTTNYRKQKRVLAHSSIKAEVPWKNWGSGNKLRIGQLLVELVCDATGIFEIRRQTRDTGGRYKQQYWLEATEASVKWIEGKNSVCELLSPVKLPCIVSPRQWTSVFDGGYYQYTGMNLVKSNDDAYMQQLASTDLKEVLHAVNTVQETGWRVNARVFEVMDRLFGSEASCSVIPEFGERSMSRPYPKEGSKEEIIEWKREATLMYSDNQRRKTKRIQFSQLMWMTRKFKDEKAFYFPHTLDFRGRLYANTAFLNPQGEDSARGLLEFSKGKPLGSSGYAWLKVHLANCWGEDKVSLEERLEWTEEHEDEILKIGIDPLACTSWMEADKPWQYLRACIEFTCCNNDMEYISHLPITVDGSCNGLQHFSAMLRDEVGGCATNLVHYDQPQDIYEIVRSHTIDIIRGDADPEFRQWATELNRALVKRPVMTTPYGATLYGMRDQIHEELKKQMDKGITFNNIDGTTDLWPHCKYLAKHIYQAIGQVVVSSRVGMQWLQDVSKVMSKADRPIFWTMPTGFVVKQKYLKSVVKQIKTVINGRMASLFAGVLRSDEKMDKARQANGIAPNLIHSLDAAHLMMTITKARNKHHIESFAVVHDSFGTHACDIEQLGVVLRETFVDLYSNDLLEKFKREQGDIELPPIPEYGTLDIKEVLESEFFFS
jgi:DNA-directed RNA polymerase, mitochondrial